jgi:hypothetical protein
MRKVLLFLLAFVSIPPAAAACTCFRPATCEVLWTAAAVFAGRVLDIRPAVQPGLTGAKAVRFAVEHPGRGVSGQEIVVLAFPETGVNCGFTFALGQR